MTREGIHSDGLWYYSCFTPGKFLIFFPTKTFIFITCLNWAIPYHWGLWKLFQCFSNEIGFFSICSNMSGICWWKHIMNPIDISLEGDLWTFAILTFVMTNPFHCDFRWGTPFHWRRITNVICYSWCCWILWNYYCWWIVATPFSKFINWGTTCRWSFSISLMDYSYWRIQ